MKRKRSILAVVAHPDDEVLGCGGTLARYATEGCNCHILILSEGVTSRDNKRNLKKRAFELKRIKIQAQKAAKILGVKTVNFNYFADNRMDSVDFLEVVKAVEKIVKKTKPVIVFTHNSSDLNIDHSITAKAVVTATRPVPGISVKEVYSFEVPSSTEWAFPEKKNVFVPNNFIDISNSLKIKIRALEAYPSEIRKFPHPRSKEAVISLAKTRGAQAGLKAAEAFCLIRRIG